MGKEHNPGPWYNPKRLQGQDKALWGNGHFPAEQFKEASGSHERSRGGSQRLYHESSFVPDGRLYDDYLKDIKDRAWPFEDAGIELGVSGARAVSRSVVRFDEI